MQSTMEKILVLRLLLHRMKNVPLLLFLTLPLYVYSQQNLITTIEISNVESVYVDRPGDLYCLLKDNTIKKFDIDGELVSEIMPDSLTTFDPRDGSRLFIYSRSKQLFSFFTQETKQEFSVELHYAIDPIFVCSSGDNQIWVLDRSDWSLKRIHPSQSKVIVEQLIDQKQFTQTPEFTFIREYQNFLFMIEKNSGILIFNSLGKQIKKIAITEIEYLNFLGEELYYKKNDKLLFYDLFDASTREVTIDPNCRFALLTDARKYLIYKNRIDIFKNE
jgi:hypothetical protein